MAAPAHLPIMTLDDLAKANNFFAAEIAEMHAQRNVSIDIIPDMFDKFEQQLTREDWNKLYWWVLFDGLDCEPLPVPWTKRQ